MLSDRNRGENASVREYGCAQCGHFAEIRLPRRPDWPEQSRRFTSWKASSRVTFGFLAISWLVFLPCDLGFAQGPSLTLSSATANPGSTVGLAVSLTAGATAPAGLQWTISYPANQIAAISATAGAASLAAGKSIACGSSAGFFTCLVSGMNANGIAAGVVANIQVTLAANAGTVVTNVSSPMGADATGSMIPAMASAGGGILVPSISAVSCTTTGLLSGGASNCTVTISQAAPAGGSSLSIGSNNSLLSVPASVIVGPAATAASFSATAGAITTDQQATITASFGSSSQQTTVSLWPTATLSALACTPTRIPLNSSASCSVTLSQPSANVAVGLTSSNSALAVPAAVNVNQGMSSATFTVNAVAAATGWVVLSASYNGSGKALALVITPATETPSLKSPRRPAGESPVTRLRDMTCGVSQLQAGGQAVCKIVFDSALTLSTTVELSSSSSSLLLPATITVRPGQSAARFRIEAAAQNTDSCATITAGIAGHTVRQTIDLTSTTSLTLPSHVHGRPGEVVSFPVKSAGANAILHASNLPAGAVFDPVAGDFQWTPGVSQQGVHAVGFTATGPGGELASARSLVEIESGLPVISRIANAATDSEDAVCSPGGIGRLEGRWLLEGSPIGAARGNSTQLAGTVVKVNGTPAPLLSASPDQVEFLCPSAAPGASLEIALRTAVAEAQPVWIVARAVAPGIFTLDGSGEGQGKIVHAGTGTLAMIPDHLHASQPAMAGDELSIYATGIEGAPELTVAMGEREITPQSIEPDPDRAGVYRINVIVPDGLSTPDVPVLLKIRMPDGSAVVSNEVMVASEISR